MIDDLPTLIERCRAGDQTAMAMLVEQFHGQVFGLCFRLLAHRQDAEDMTQESFIRVFKSLSKYDSNRDFRPWLFSIAGNRCRTLIATRAHRPKTNDVVVEELLDPAPEPRGMMHVLEEVELALTGLRAEHRRAFLLFHAEHLSYLEIAATLDCPLGTVKTWVSRARRDLAAVLRERGLAPTAALQEKA